MTGKVVILGIFVADTAYRADRAPRMGETLLGNSFALGPGGKGSNQAVAAGRLGADVHFITKLGEDPFADMALSIWKDSGVKPAISQHPDQSTGAAYIFIEEATGDNAIIVCPGVATTISPDDMNARSDLITSADVFVTQLEQPVDAACRALMIAKSADVVTVLNPAPAAELPAGMLSQCNYITPNESETEALCGLPVTSLEEAETAAHKLLDTGVGAVVITLGEKGALYCDRSQSTHIPACNAGPVVETTGAGDAFNGGFATALARGDDPVSAVRYGCAVAGISVTRPGTAPSMPTAEEVNALLAKG